MSLLNLCGKYTEEAPEKLWWGGAVISLLRAGGLSSFIFFFKDIAHFWHSRCLYTIKDSRNIEDLIPGEPYSGYQ